MANFKLRYSPLFYEDLDAITDYILYELKNGPAVKSLVDSTETAIKQRLEDPLSTTPYPSIGHHKYPYRRVLVGNYLIFYVVIDNTMVVRRMLYGRRDLVKIL